MEIRYGKHASGFWPHWWHLFHICRNFVRAVWCLFIWWFSLCSPGSYLFAAGCPWLCATCYMAWIGRCTCSQVTSTSDSVLWTAMGLPVPLWGKFTYHFQSECMLYVEGWFSEIWQSSSKVILGCWVTPKIVGFVISHCRETTRWLRCMCLHGHQEHMMLQLHNTPCHLHWHCITFLDISLYKEIL